MDNKVDVLRAKISFQRDSKDCNILCLTKSWLSPDILSPSIPSPGSHYVTQKGIKNTPGKRKAEVYVS
jgi:hypothetical protein